MKHLTLALAFSFLASSVLAQQATPDDSMKDCPMHQQRTAQSHHAIVNGHGDQAMGFPHDQTTHHFRMAPDGGSIEVTVRDAKDKTNTDAIRSHLSHISAMFADGDFSAPMFIHDGVPPGVTTMARLKSVIHYTYAEMPLGGKVRIQSTDDLAVDAIHDFLRFQITEHQTGDSLEAAHQ
jgi:hypothetical protein